MSASINVIDYEKDDFTRNGRRYDLILDTRTNRRPSDYVRSLNPGGTYATVGGPLMRDLFKVAIFGLWSRPVMNKALRLVGLKQNRDLPYLNERFEAGQLVPVIDGPYKLSDAREAFRHFGAGNHKGKIVFTIENASDRAREIWRRRRRDGCRDEQGRPRPTRRLAKASHSCRAAACLTWVDGPVATRAQRQLANAGSRR